MSLLKEVHFREAVPFHSGHGAVISDKNFPDTEISLSANELWVEVKWNRKDWIDCEYPYHLVKRIVRKPKPTKKVKGPSTK